MRLSRWLERLLDPQVDIESDAREPARASTRQGRRLLDLAQPEHAAVEPARLGLAAGRDRELHVIGADDEGRRDLRQLNERTLRGACLCW